MKYIFFSIIYILYILYRATIMQHETSNAGKGNVEAVSVAIPAVMRTGVDGKNIFNKFFPQLFHAPKSVSYIISKNIYILFSEKYFFIKM